MFSKVFIAPNGARAEVHRLRGIEAKFPEATGLTLFVSSYTSLLDYLTEGRPVWDTPLVRPFTPLGAGFLGVLEDWVITDPSSPFVGGVVVNMPDASNALTYARQLKGLQLVIWAREKMALVNIAVAPAALNAAVQDIRTQAGAYQSAIAAAATQADLDAIVLT